MPTENPTHRAPSDPSSLRDGSVHFIDRVRILDHVRNHSVSFRPLSLRQAQARCDLPSYYAHPEQRQRTAVIPENLRGFYDSHTSSWLVPSAHSHSTLHVISVHTVLPRAFFLIAPIGTSPKNSMSKEFIPIASQCGDGTTAAELRGCVIGGCCGKRTPKLSPGDVTVRLPSVPQWTLSDDGNRICKSFVAKNWAAAMAWMNKVSDIAEAEGHHPDVHLTNWRDVRIEMWTHAIGGLSLPDFVMAAKMDAVEVVLSPKWVKEQAAAAAAATASSQPNPQGALQGGR